MYWFYTGFMTGSTHWTDSWQAVEAIVREAGHWIMEWRQARGQDISQWHIEEKGTDDPVTEADKGASQLIIDALRRLFPEHRIVSEEDLGEAKEAEFVWLVDPIDGTKEFISGTAEWAVSVGLVQRGGQPVFGVVYAPMTDECWSGGESIGLYKNGERIILPQQDTQKGLLVSSSEYHREGWAAQDWTAWEKLIPMGSAALKLARLAEGEATGLFSTSPRAEWDICAGHALLLAVGGELRRRDGREIVYGDGSQIGRYSVGWGLVGARSNWETLQADLELRGIALTGLKQEAGRVIGFRKNAEKEARMILENGSVKEATGEVTLLKLLTRDIERAGLVQSEAKKSGIR